MNSDREWHWKGWEKTAAARKNVEFSLSHLSRDEKRVSSGDLYTRWGIYCWHVNHTTSSERTRAYGRYGVLRVCRVAKVGEAVSLSFCLWRSKALLARKKILFPILNMNCLFILLNYASGVSFSRNSSEWEFFYLRL